MSIDEQQAAQFPLRRPKRARNRWPAVAIVVAMVVGIVSAVGASPAAATSAVNAVSNDGVSIDVTWSPPSGSSNFEVYLNGQYQRSTDKKQTRLTGLSPSTTYAVRIDGWISGTKFNVGSAQVTTAAGATGAERGGATHGGNGNNPTNPNANPDDHITDNTDPLDPTNGTVESAECPSCIALGLNIARIGGLAGLLTGGVVIGICAATVCKAKIRADSTPRDWQRQKMDLQRLIETKKLSRLDASELQISIRNDGRRLMNTIPDDCFNRHGNFRPNHGTCSKFAGGYVAARDMMAWQVKPGTGSGDFTSAQDPAPNKGDFTCKHNGQRYFSNGSAYLLKDAMTRDVDQWLCRDVTLTFHVYCGGKHVRTVTPPNRQKQTCPSSGGGTTTPPSGQDPPRGDFTCKHNGQRYFSNGSAYLLKDAMTRDVDQWLCRDVTLTFHVYCGGKHVRTVTPPNRQKQTC